MYRVFDSHFCGWRPRVLFAVLSCAVSFVGVAVVQMMWRELEDDRKEEYYKEAAKVCGRWSPIDKRLHLHEKPTSQLVQILFEALFLSSLSNDGGRSDSGGAPFFLFFGPFSGLVYLSYLRPRLRGTLKSSR